MPEPDDTRSLARGRAAGWWLAVGGLVLGLFIGGIVVGLASGGSADDLAGPTATVAPAAGSSIPSGGATGQVAVNASCLRAVNDAQDTYTAVNDLADAARTLNAARLDEIVRRLQPLQRRLEQDLRSCQVTARLPDGSVSSGPVPTPAPTS